MFLTNKVTLSNGSADFWLSEWLQCGSNYYATINFKGFSPGTVEWAQTKVFRALKQGFSTSSQGSSTVHRFCWEFTPWPTASGGFTLYGSSQTLCLLYKDQCPLNGLCLLHSCFCGEDRGYVKSRREEESFPHTEPYEKWKNETPVVLERKPIEGLGRWLITQGGRDGKLKHGSTWKL